MGADEKIEQPTEGEFMDFDGEEIDEAYDPEPMAREPGELRGRVKPGGGIEFGFVADKDKSPHFSKWKGRNKIMACDDDQIKFIGDFATGTYYTVLGSTVKYRGKGDGEKRQYLCLKPGHDCNDCPHTRRLAKYREDHPHEVAATP